jgi:hypothetical protein
MNIPVLTDAFAEALLSNLAPNWATADLHVALFDAGYVFDPVLAPVLPAANIIASAPLTGRTVKRGWAVANPALIQAYDLPRKTTGVCIGQFSGGNMTPFAKLSLLPVDFVPTTIPFWLTWQAEGIFRP